MNYSVSSKTCSHSQSILTNFLHFSSGQLFFGIAFGIYRLIAARVLGPSDFGRFVVLEMAVMVGGLAGLGVLGGLYRELPRLLGAGRTGEARDIQRVAFSFSLGVAAVVLLVGLLVSWLVPFEWRTRIVGTAATATIAAALVVGCFEYLYRAFQQFHLVRGSVITAGVAQFANIPLILWLGYGGALIGFLVPYLARIAYGFFMLRDSLQMNWSLEVRILRRLIKAGVPLLAVEYLGILRDYLDRWLVVTNLGVSFLGLYTAPRNLAGFATGIFTQPLNSVVFVHFGFLLGRTDSSEQVNLQLRKLFWLVILFVPAISALNILVLPTLVHYLLPDYGPGIFAAQIIIVGQCFLSSFGFIEGLLIHLQGVRLVIWGTALSFFGTLVLSMVLVTLGLGVKSFAIGFSAGASLYALFVFAAVLRFLKTGKRERLVYFVSGILMISLFLGVAWIINVVATPVPTGPLGDVVVALVSRVGIFAVAAILLVGGGWLVLNRTRFLWTLV